MLPPIITGWPVSRSRSGQACHAGAEGAGGALAVDQHFPHPAVDHVLLQFGGVVRHIVDHVHPQLGRIPVQHLGEHLADAVQDHLAVGKGHVDGALHRRKIVLPFRGAERGAGQFPVEDPDVVFGFHDLQEQLQVIGRHLMAEAAAAAVEHDHHLVGDTDAEGPGEMRVEDVFRPGHLDLQVMVARAQGADLLVAPLHRPVADLAAVGAGDAAALLGRQQILRQAVTPGNGTTRRPVR